MGCSTFSEYTVIAAISAAKVSPHYKDLDQLCVLGCGVSTGWGAVFNTCKVEPGTSVAVFGLGAVGLAVIQAAKVAGAKSIVGIDINAGKFEISKSLGATNCVSPKDFDSYDDCKKKLMEGDHKWGYDYTFDCTGNTTVMRQALELAHRGWG
jgi:Zn-dependent alcohol dehydrogenase